MLLYKCRFTGDEMLTDAFKPRPVLDDENNPVIGLIQIDSQRVNKVRDTFGYSFGCSSTGIPVIVFVPRYEKRNSRFLGGCIRFTSDPIRF
jgi:hypothetical protein